MHEVIIKPNSRWCQFNFQELWQYRDLLLLLVYRDFSAKYKQTILGPLWFIIQPLLTTLVFTVIFGKVAKVPTDGVPPLLFYLCGLMAWNYFAQTFTNSSTSLTANAGIFGKVYFPRIIPSLAIAINNVMMFVIQLLTFMLIYAGMKIFGETSEAFSIHWTVVFMPLIIILAGVFSLGCGLWMTSLTVRYRDFQHLSTFIVQLWMFATPIVYPLSSIPEKWRWWVVLNPMTPVVESFKLMFLGEGTVEVGHLMLAMFVSAAVFISGILYFQKVERTFVDSV